MQYRLELWNVHLCNSLATLAASGIWIYFPFNDPWENLCSQLTAHFTASDSEDSRAQLNVVSTSKSSKSKN